ncbi:4Fe-4S dicluster domain-containing protein [Anaeromicrobium sediminis]|uniref:Oxidoreductase n=1 Tax=Anaeromicrobium sediminis TaxID=1478221 RepID=A0A267MM37_9FIRM|nr:4Fe-4S dicluster domain-containing protein [Anaeromicrobium sediminis]PAB60606.1 oxidoreductase [Anaeromicrobium sediminis]
MEKLIVHGESCKSCKYCINACPKEALSVTTHINDKGYATVAVDQKKCVCCGICYNVCPDYVFEIQKGEV